MARAGVALLLLASASSAEEMPVEAGMTLLLKVLTYEAGFDARGAGDFVVLVPHSADGKAAADQAVEKLTPLTRAKVRARALVFVAVKAPELSATVAARKASAILVLPGADAALLAEASRLGREAHVYTLGLDEGSVKSVALGVTAKEGKPQVLLNVAQAKAEGSEFPQSILKVARLIR